MGFMKKISSAFKKTLRAVFRDDDDTSPPPPVTGRYLHVSVPLEPIEDPMLRKMLGRDYLEHRPGRTRSVGSNWMKAAADRMGKNNKERRRLRAKIKHRAEELIALHTTNPNVQGA